MNPEQVFGLCNTAALAGWVLLAVFPRRRWTAPLVSGSILPLLLGVVYAGLLLGHLGGPGSFSTLAAVAQLFSNPWLLLAGWVHYLAFDLFIGSWQVRDAARRGIPRWQVLPCLVLTFMLGPIGLLVYLALRAARTTRLSVDEALS